MAEKRIALTELLSTFVTVVIFLSVQMLFLASSPFDLQVEIHQC